ncbi:MAG: PBP1A family penicillin-binding protein [Alphaproteobacteria bacterium GM7ARS4]|nr:PBP1A family penicillin-binding protein [Alphaproteobacteria bacterium GM7ARS4]
MVFFLKWAIRATPFVLLLGMGAFVYYAYDLPAMSDMGDTTQEENPSLLFLDAQGKPLAVRGGEFYSHPVRWQDLPQSLIDAVLATEDRRFFQHPGWDWRGIVRALWANIRAGAIVEGGSTITQQLAKNMFLSPERDVRRKVQEWLLALLLELKYSKQEIFTIYLNRAYMGNGIWGVGAASLLYFDKPVAHLDLYESALMAGLLRAPSRYSPANDPERAHGRTRQVLRNMVDDGRIDHETAEQLASTRYPPKPQVMTKDHVHYFIDWLMNTHIADMVGEVEEDIIIHTTLDSAIQDKASHAVARMLHRHGEKKHIEQTSALVMSPNGAVRMMIGGANYQKSKFNRVYQAFRQPGSAFKLFVYLAGLEAGMGGDTKVLDALFDLGGWIPKNFKDTYHGEVSVRYALAHSLNTVAVRVSEYVGRENVIAMARRLGITSPIQEHPSIALGTAGVSLLELTSAYATLAHGGAYVQPWGITLIRSRTRNKVYYQHDIADRHDVLNDKDVESMNALLAYSVQEGSGTHAQMGRAVAGKTGTSQAFRDAWFIGYTKDYVGGIWMGNDKEEPMDRVTGGSLPAQLWRDIMTHAHDGFPPHKTFGVHTPRTPALERLPSDEPPSNEPMSHPPKEQTIDALMDRLGL